MEQEHLDAETVASWAEGTLDPQIRAAAESHAADCVRCQAVLAAMARTEAAAARPAAGWLASRVRWLVPLATAAAAAALWVGLSLDVLAPGTPPVASRTEPAAAQAPEPAAAPAVIAGSVDAAKQEAAPDESRRLRAEPPPPASARGVARRAENPEVVAEKRVVADRVSAPRSAASRPAAPPPPPEVSRLPVLTETVAVQTPSPQPQARAGERMLAKPAAFADAMAPRDVATPDPAVRYRVGAKGLIQRSGDGGRTWIAQRSGVTADLLAGAAPSSDVCWVIGRSGVVLLTTDGGATWRRAPFPDPIDLIAVEAADARAATVTARDDRVFRTLDGGATWQR